MHTRLALGLTALTSAGLLACILLAEGPEEGRRYASIVGVQNYEGTGLGSLQVLRQRRRRPGRRHLGKLGYRVTLLTRPEWKAQDRDDLLPTADNIRDHIRAVLRNRRPTDTVLLAFAGHGEQLKQDGKMYFCPAKCNLDRPETLVSLDWVYDRNEGADKEHAAGGEGADRGRLPQRPPGGRGRRAARSWRARRGRNCPSLEAARWRRSRLLQGGDGLREQRAQAQLSCSTFVIDGLEGKAEGKGGRIKWTDLTKHVDDELSDAVAKEIGPNAVQTPEVRGDSHGLVLAQLDAGHELVGQGNPCRGRTGRL